MDCRESRELMSGAVDNELRKNESDGFQEHIEICGSCRDEFELEKLTKAYIKRKITFVDVPIDLEETILAQISADGSSGMSQGFFSRLLSNQLLQPIMAVGVVLIIAVALFFANRPNIIMPILPGNSAETAQASNQDILLLAMNNFQDVLSGKFKTQITAINTSDVSHFLARNTGYSMQLPPVPDADWIGGSVTNTDGTKAAHIVYKIGEGYIYIYSIPRQAVNSGDASLPSTCKDAIQKNHWYWGMDQNGDTQAVWCSDNQVCVATANLEKKDLAGYLGRPVTSEQ